MVLQILRLIAVMVLLIAAAALATPPGRLPLALRGLQKILRREAAAAPAPELRASPRRRLMAFLLVLLAMLLALA